MKLPVTQLNFLAKVKKPKEGPSITFDPFMADTGVEMKPVKANITLVEKASKLCHTVIEEERKREETCDGERYCYASDHEMWGGS